MATEKFEGVAIHDGDVGEVIYEPSEGIRVVFDANDNIAHVRFVTDATEDTEATEYVVPGTAVIRAFKAAP